MNRPMWISLRLLGACAAGPRVQHAGIPRSSPPARPQLYLGLGHSEPISCLAWSPDGRTLASGSDDHTVVLWDAATWKPRATLSGHIQPVVALVWSPDGKLLASSDEGDVTFVWDAATGNRRVRLAGNLQPSAGPVKPSITWPDATTLATVLRGLVAVLWDPLTGRRRSTLRSEGRYPYTAALTWSPDGKTLATSDSSSVMLWDAATGRRLGALADPGDFLFTLAWSPDGRTLGGVLYDGTAVLWDAATGRLRARLAAQPEAGGDDEHGIRLMAWSADGRTLVTGPENGDAILWNAQTGARRARFAGEGFDMDALAWSPDGKKLAGSGYSTTLLWDTQTGRHVSMEGGPPLAWRPDGKLLATSGTWEDPGLVLWDGPTGKRHGFLPLHITPVAAGCLAWGPDGRQVAAGAGRELQGAAFVWDAGTGRLERKLTGYEAPVSGLGWSPDGRRIAVASGYLMSEGPDGTGPGWLVWERGSATVADAASAERRLVLKGAAGPLAWSRDGKILVTGPGLLLWDAATGKRRAALNAGGVLQALTWSPDGRALATVAGETWAYKTVTVWDAATWKPRVTFVRANTGALPWPYTGALVWSPDGKRLAVGGPDSRTTILDGSTGRARSALPDQTSPALVAAWRPDGRVLATGYWNGSVKLWTAASGTLVAILSGQSGPITALAWGPDGKLLASGSSDHTVILWDANARKARARLVGHTGVIQALTWSPDGRTLATGSVDGSLRLWNGATGELRAACYAIDGGREWVTATAEGYFVASAHGADFIQWGQGGRLWPVSKFRRRFERPDLVRESLAP